MKIYLVRHGETDMNDRHLFQGRVDTVLNDNGIEQANELARELKEKGIVFDSAYSSPLERALKTCEIVYGENRNHIRIDKRLIEMEFGEYEGTGYYELVDKINEMFIANPEADVLEGGIESMKSIRLRLASFLEDLKRDPGDNILIVCHGAVLRGMFCLMGYAPWNEFWKQRIGNCGVVEAELVGGEYRILPGQDLRQNVEK